MFEEILLGENAELLKISHKLFIFSVKKINSYEKVFET